MMKPYENCADPELEAFTDKALPYIWRVIAVSLALLFARHAVSFL